MRIVILLLATLGTPIWGQSMMSARAGTIYYAEGSPEIDGQRVRAGRTDRRPQIQDGQTLTTVGGHSEILLGAGAVLWVSNRSKVTFQDTRVEDMRVALGEGAAMVEVKSTPAGSHLRFLMGDASADLDRVGLYRFDAGPGRIRVYDGQAALSASGQNVTLRPGQQATLRERAPVKLDRRDMDEFHYWSAQRSLQLETEAGGHRAWHGDSAWMYSNTAFGVQFPNRPTGAARAMYLAGAEAGLVYVLNGSAYTALEANPRLRLPFRMGKDNYLRSTKGSRAEIFLGIGVVAYLDENAQLRIIDTSSTTPVAALDEGVVLIEVGSLADKSVVRVRVGDSITQLTKPGLYRFDAKAGSLLVYGGEASTIVSDVPAHAKAGQIVNLREGALPAKFDPHWKDALFDWAALQSFRLYSSSAWFMVDWSQAGLSNKVKHKQFGERAGRGGAPPQLRARPPVD